MRIDTSIAQLTNGRPAVAPQRLSMNLVRAANSHAANRLGIVEGELPGGYRGVFSTGTRKVEDDVFGTRALTRTKNVYEDRPVTETRDVYGMRDITETRDVTETRDIVELRDVMGTRDVMMTVVTGTRDLRPYAGTSAAGIANGATFAIAVGDDAGALVKFVSATQITVTRDGQTTQFNHASGGGAYRASLVAALSSIDGLAASQTSDGKLELVSAETIRIDDGTGGSGGGLLADLLELVGGLLGGLLGQPAGPLAALGLSSGTYDPDTLVQQEAVVGQEEVVVGQQQVVIGQEDVVIGQEEVVVDQETVITGYRQEKVGERDVAVGAERIKTGTETRIEKGERKLVGLTKDGYGVGYLEILDKLSSGGGLPPGYVDALFGNAGSRAGTDMQGSPWSPSAAYAEADSFASRDDATSSRWPSFKASED